MDSSSYRIGWIAPLPLELTAAIAMLDEDHGDAHVGGYIFHRGRIGRQNIVLSVQPRMGTDAASDLAARMRAAFPQIEYFLVVGIGGGVPSHGRSSTKAQIVLGDVVVSCPRGRHGGVVRYDFGAWADDGRLEFKGHTNGPPASLLNVVNALRARHSISGSQTPSLLQEMRSKLHADSRRKFEDPGGENDDLFDDDYRHPDSSRDMDCKDCCDHNRATERHFRGDGALRETDTPKIHYGNIASSNQLQISALKRRQVQEELDVICFEMEGAGVIQMHPALVIRGVCDYADSHKNKDWQPYAAATAAAYAKELLQVLPVSKLVDMSSPQLSEWTTDAVSTFKLSESVSRQDLSWFYKAFDMELQEVRYDLYSCGSSNHTNDEYLMGFTNSSGFQSWLSASGSILWCRLSRNRVAHLTTGACLIRQAIKPLNHRVYTLGYKCREYSSIVLPEEYRQLKEKLLNDRDSEGNAKESSRRQDLIEVILLSFLMQAMQYGFKVELGSIVMTHPQLFLSSLIAAFTDALKSQPCRVIIVIDKLELVQEPEMAAVISTLTGIINHDQSNLCSVMLASERSPTVSSLLKGYPMVHSDSEYQDCLQSLHMKDRNVRRSEIAEPVRSSNTWIWSHPAFENLMSQKSNALAVIGKAGSGKSVLAKTIQRGIMAQSLSSDTLVAADWFYCRRKGSPFTAYASLLMSILYEILARAKHTAFASYKAVYRRQAPSQARTWTTLELEQILKSLAHSSVPLFLVFDAIDEANDLYTIPLVEDLVSQPFSEIRIVILSRPMLQLQTSFWSSRSITLQYENSGDIQEVINDGLLNLYRTMLGDHDDADMTPFPAFQSHAGLSSGGSFETGRILNPAENLEGASKSGIFALEAELREKSNGVILWLVLVFESLCKVVKSEITISVDELASYISQFPIEIQPVYTQMVEELSSRLSSNGLKKARSALMWINVAPQTKQFTLSELWDALAIPEVSPPHTGAHPITSRREAIRNWQDFQRKIQAMCGSFVEIFPDKTDRSLKSSGSFTITGDSVVQLMHQTAKDFLTASRGAAYLSFTEEEAFDLVSERIMRYMNLVFPSQHGISKPAGIFYRSSWQEYLSQVASYLNEFRLVEFACQFYEGLPNQWNDLQPYSQMMWNGFLNDADLATAKPIPENFFAGWRYDMICRASDERVSSALGYVIQFTTSLGLKSAVQNLLCLSNLQDWIAFWDVYGDAILNAVLFTILDQRDHPNYYTIRQGLILPEGSRRESATLALDHLDHMNRSSEIRNRYAQHLTLDIRNVYDIAEKVMKHAYGTRVSSRSGTMAMEFANPTARVVYDREDFPPAPEIPIEQLTLEQLAQLYLWERRQERAGIRKSKSPREQRWKPG